MTTDGHRSWLKLAINLNRRLSSKVSVFPTPLHSARYLMADSDVARDWNLRENEDQENKRIEDH